MEIIYSTVPRRVVTGSGGGIMIPVPVEHERKQRNKCTIRCASVLCFNAASSAAHHITTRPRLIIKCCLVQLVQFGVISMERAGKNKKRVKVLFSTRTSFAQILLVSYLK
jgi:hypothetical protein